MQRQKKKESKNLPISDIAVVKHGEWIEDGYYDIACVCSYCGEEAHYTSKLTGCDEIREYIKSPYCPNCGAKMDEMKEEQK